MINLKNLIDFLPFEYKDQDTYKVNGKGILERFLEICGEHFEEYITEDISNILEIIDIDNTPDMYLNFLWQFLGEMPFAYGNTIDTQKWSEYFNGFYSDNKIQELSKVWLIPKEGPFSLNSNQVRNVLKYSISLFKIRGTAEFFEIMMRLYGLTCIVNDPSKSDNYDGWFKLDSKFDQEDSLFESYRFDNSYNCTQCIPVTFTITGHGYSSNTPEFQRFREAIRSFFERFIPYNVSYILKFGFNLNDNYQIKAELVNPGQSKLTDSIGEVPVMVTVTSSWKEADLRFQISSDQTVWGSKHPSGYIFRIPREGTYYFRSVGDPSKITSITIGKEIYARTYQITYDSLVDRITPTNLKALVVVRANTSYRGSITLCSVRLSGTTQVKPSGSTWEFDKPGTYFFEIVEFPSMQTSFIVTQEPITYKVTCNPSEYRVTDNNPIREAITTLDITSNYPEKVVGKLSAQLIGYPTLIPNGGTFKANSYGSYKFKCIQDLSNEEENLGRFDVIFGKAAVYLLSINPKVSTLYDGVAKTSVALTFVSGIGKDTRVRVVETGQIFDAKLGYEYTTNKAGTYTFQSVAYPLAMATWVVNNTPPVYLPDSLIIVPTDPEDSSWKEPNWSLPEEQIDASQALYQLTTKDSSCKFSIRELKNGFDVEGTVSCDETRETYNLGKEIVLTKPGTYTFSADDGISSTCQVVVEDFPLQINLTIDPSYAELKGSIKQVSALIRCTSNKSDFDSRVREVGKVNMYEAGGDGYEFITSQGGEYIFESVADPTKRVKFTVKDANISLNVSPQLLEWDADDLSEKSFTITTLEDQTWIIEEL